MDTYCRPLNDNILVGHFVRNILEIEDVDKRRDAIKAIIRTEMQNSQIQGKCTLSHNNYRDEMYADEQSRKELRKKIFEELISQNRPKNDDDIKLGFGGALPIGIEPMKKKQAYIVIGLPASGKSGIANIISDSYGAIILDSDFAKRKFPEFEQDFGASLVHEESSDIIFGHKGITKYNMLQYCCINNYNIVIPTIGQNIKPILGIAINLRDHWAYDIHITLVSLDRKKATQRAYNRFINTSRYVPLSLIFDGFSNDSILTYYRLRNNPIFKSYGKISTDVPFGDPPKFIECSDDNPAKLFE